MNRHTLGQVGTTVVAVAALAASALAAPSAAASDSRTQYYRYVPLCGPATAGQMSCYAIKRVVAQQGDQGAVAATAATTTAPGVAVGPSGGYTPGDLAAAYGVDPNAPTTGQTVAIVDAHDKPNAVKDLDAFDAQYGIPAETSRSFEKVGQDGGAHPVNSNPPTATELGWAGEIALDLEAVRGICHTCRILLVEADSDNSDDLATAVNTAVRLGATEVSNSYGSPEGAFAGDPRNDEKIKTLEATYNHPGVVITASTGDDGYDDFDLFFDGETSDNAPSSPASYPSVVAVAGTSLQLNDDGTRASESVWNLNGQYGITAAFNGASLGASGGGCSVEFDAPLWQTALSGWGQTGCGSGRLNGDVAALGDPQTGYDVYDTYADTGWGVVGGTSLSAPLIAAMWALAGGSHGVPYPALSLYGNEQSNPASLYDVTTGGDGLCDGSSVGQCQAFWAMPGADSPNELGSGQLDCAWVGETAVRSAGTRACDAATGYDGASGVGTPNGVTSFQPLQPRASITGRTKTRLGKNRTYTGAASDPYPGGAIASYTWTLTKAGGRTKTYSGSSLALKFHTKGTYTLTLTVTDNYGFGDTHSVTIEVKKKKHHHRHHHHKHHQHHH